MNLKTIGVIVCSLLFHLSPDAQTAPVTTAGSVNGHGPIVTVPVTVTNFVDIGAISLTMNYDFGNVQITGILPSVSLPGFTADWTSYPGTITMGWYGTSGVTLSDNAHLVDILFTGPGGAYSALTWADDGGSCEYAKYDGGFNHPLPDTPTSSFYINGSVTIETPYSPVTIAPVLLACPGTTIGIPVKVTGFIDIGAISLYLNYNDASLLYDHCTNTSGFPGLIFNSPMPGTFIAGGYTPGPGMTYPDSTTLFTIYFTYKGGSSGLGWYDDGGSCEYAGPWVFYPPLIDTPKSTYYIDGSVNSPAIPPTDPDINATFINVTVPGNVSTNDDAPEGTTYGTPDLVSGPTGSTYALTMDTDGAYSFEGNQPGIYVFTVPVYAPGAVSPTCVNELLTITAITPSLYPPVANTDIATTLQGMPVTLNTMANDLAGNAGGMLDPSSVTIISGTAPDHATQGDLSINPLNGEITFTPVVSFTGVITYKYQICDNTMPTALCTTATQKVTVLPAGSANTTEASDDYNVTPQGVTLSVPALSGVLANDNDPEGNTQIVTTTSPITVPFKGTITFGADGSYLFVPFPVFRGGVGFPYTVSDNGSPAAHAHATLYLIVTSFKTDPDINVTYENAEVSGNVHTNDDVIVGTTYGTPTLASGPAGSTGLINMDPSGTYYFTGDLPGIYSYDVPVCSPGLPSPPCVNELLTITVLASSTNNNPPIASTDEAYSLGQPVTIHTLANDLPGNAGGTLNPASVAIIACTTPNPCTEGCLVIDHLTGDIIFTPVGTYGGTIDYWYTVSDNSLPTPLSATAMQEVTVLLSGTTQAADDYNVTPQGVTLTVSDESGVLSNDSDPESDSQTVTSTSPVTIPGKGTLSIESDGGYVFVPETGFSGPVSFPYTITDNGVPPSSASATLYLTVTPGHTISGWMKYNNPQKSLMPGVTVELKDLSENIIGSPSVTNSSGHYQFTNVTNGNYKLEISNNNEVSGSINSTDASQVNAWLTGAYFIQHVNFLAGDVYGNGIRDFPNFTLTSNDAWHIQQYFVNGGIQSTTYTYFDRGPWCYYKADSLIISNIDPATG